MDMTNKASRRWRSNAQLCSTMYVQRFLQNCRSGFIEYFFPRLYFSPTVLKEETKTEKKENRWTSIVQCYVRITYLLEKKIVNFSYVRKFDKISSFVKTWQIQKFKFKNYYRNYVRTENVLSQEFLKRKLGYYFLTFSFSSSSSISSLLSPPPVFSFYSLLFSSLIFSFLLLLFCFFSFYPILFILLLVLLSFPFLHLQFSIFFSSFSFFFFFFSLSTSLS